MTAMDWRKLGPAMSGAIIRSRGKIIHAGCARWLMNTRLVEYRRVSRNSAVSRSLPQVRHGFSRCSSIPSVFYIRVPAIVCRTEVSCGAPIGIESPIPLRSNRRDFCVLAVGLTVSHCELVTEILEKPIVSAVGAKCGPRVGLTASEAKEIARAMYLAGETPSKIELSTGVKAGTISMWATRGNWATTRKHVEIQVQRRVGAAIGASLEAESNAVRGKLSSSLVGTANKLASLKPSVGGKRVGALKATAETAALVYGWKNEQNQVSVSVSLLESAQSAPVDPPA